MKYGYARVSSDGQSVDAQVRQLTKAGCKKVFREVASGAKTDRAQLRRLLDMLDAGDLLTVTRLDRLARSTRDLLNTLAAITGKKAGFRSLGDIGLERVELGRPRRTRLVARRLLVPQIAPHRVARDARFPRDLADALAVPMQYPDLQSRLHSHHPAPPH
jgi:Resolvase, N terminal domain